MLRSLSKAIQLNDAKCELVGGLLNISGKHGKMTLKCPNFLELIIDSKTIIINPLKNLTVKQDRAMAGTFKANLMLSIKGVNELHSKVVIFSGTGSSVKEGQVNQDGANVNGLLMRVGKSHIVERAIPDGLSCKVESSDIRETKLRVSGIDLTLVGRFASQLVIRRAYKGGVRAEIEGQAIPVKEGKSG